MPEKNEAETHEWHRHFAAQCNNRAWRLAEAVDRFPTDDEEMQNAAHAAALHWSKVGTELNTARAQMLLGQVHGLLGNGKLAMRYAQSAFDYLTAHECPDWERGFAHAVLANAAAADGNGELHRHHHGIARALGDSLANAEDRSIFDATFQRIPIPRGTLYA